MYERMIDGRQHDPLAGHLRGELEEIAGVREPLYLLLQRREGIYEPRVLDAHEVSTAVVEEHEVDVREGVEVADKPLSGPARALGNPGELAILKGVEGEYPVGLAV